MSELKDSGERREFSTGAVRDMADGKGRCDLMPLDIVADLLNDPVIANISNYQKNADITYLYRALKTYININNLNISTVMLDVAKHFEDGAKKYGENNWQKGLPVSCYIDSAVRHYLKVLRGDQDEPHDRAFVWNIMCCIWTIKNHKDVK